MADPLIVPDVCRYLVEMTLGGRDLGCIIDMAYIGGVDREGGLIEIGRVVLDAWDDGPRTRQSADVSCVRVSWLDLDSATGTTGSVTAGVGGVNVWPAAGGRAENSQASNVAVRMNKDVAAIRGLHGGRMYIPGVTEPSTDVPNQLNAASLTAWQTACTAMVTDLQGVVAPVDGGAADFAVVHQPAVGAPSYSLVTSGTVLAALKSQGRRLR